MTATLTDPAGEALRQLRQLEQARVDDDYQGVRQALRTIATCLREVGDRASAQVILDVLTESETWSA